LSIARSTVTDNLFARVTGVSRHSDGYQNVVDFACAHPTLAGALQVRDPSKAHHCITGTQGGISVSGLRGQLRWVVGENFEANLAVVRQCAKYKKRIIFPSTSEVYGMCPDKELDEAGTHVPLDFWLLIH